MTAHRSISTLRFEEAEVSLGDELRGARASSGKSLDQIERELKIKAAYILAIEDARPDQLPDMAYAAGFVRAYARFLGLDSDKTLARFIQESEAAAKAAGGQPARGGLLGVGGLGAGASRAEAPARRAKADPLAGLARGKEPNRVLGGLLGGAAMLAPIVFAGGILWGGWKLLDHAGVAAVFGRAEPAPVSVTVAPPAPPAAAALERPSAAAYERRVEAYWAAASDQSSPQPPRLPPIDAPLGASMPRGAAAVSPASLEGAATGFALIAERAVWLEVRDAASAETLFSGTLNPGDRFTPPEGRVEGMILNAGDPSGLRVEIGGQDLGLFSAANAMVSGFDLNAASLRKQVGAPEAVSTPEASAETPPEAQPVAAAPRPAPTAPRPAAQAAVPAPAAPRPVAPAAVRAPAPPAPALVAAPVYQPAPAAVSPPSVLPPTQRVQRLQPETRVVSNPAPVYLYPEAAPDGRAFGSMRPVD